MDEKIRAFDSATGKLLWERTLPFGGYATPTTYSVDGRQSWSSRPAAAESSGPHRVTRSSRCAATLTDRTISAPFGARPER